MKMFKEVTLFAIFSAVSNLMALLGSLFAVTFFNPVIASAIGFVVGMIFGFLLQKNFTFKPKKTSTNFQQSAKYSTLYGFGFFLNIVFAWCWNNFFPNSFLLAQVLTIVTTGVFMFAGQKMWVFGAGS